MIDGVVVREDDERVGVIGGVGMLYDDERCGGVGWWGGDERG